MLSLTGLTIGWHQNAGINEMDKFYLQFNAVNFVTVVLMALVGITVLNLIISLVTGKKVDEDAG